MTDYIGVSKYRPSILKGMSADIAIFFIMLMVRGEYLWNRNSMSVHTTHSLNANGCLWALWCYFVETCCLVSNIAYVVTQYMYYQKCKHKLVCVFNTQPRRFAKLSWLIFDQKSTFGSVTLIWTIVYASFASLLSVLESKKHHDQSL